MDLRDRVKIKKDNRKKKRKSKLHMETTRGDLCDRSETQMLR